MTPLVINLRGNSGSGKTYTTRQFLACAEYVNSTEEDQLVIYNHKEWAVLGRYSNVCGGCDTIRTQREIAERIERYTKDGINVWLEGLILSTIYGGVGAYSEKFGNRWVFAYLQPPIEECIRRIKLRRAAAGNDKPLNEDNTRKRERTIVRNREIVLGHQRRVVDLDWQAPMPQLMKIVRKEAL